MTKGCALHQEFISALLIFVPKNMGSSCCHVFMSWHLLAVHLCVGSGVDTESIPLVVEVIYPQMVLEMLSAFPLMICVLVKYHCPSEYFLFYGMFFCC